jgi:ABC-type lipoprotein release transport system permease subunit
MIWFRLAWRNLWRNRRRSTLQLISVGGRVFLAVFFQNFATGTYDKVIAEGTIVGSGHIGVYADGYLVERKASLVFDGDALAPRIASRPNVAAVLPRAYVPGLIQSSRESRPGVALGMDFDRERDWNPLLKPARLIEGKLPDPAAAVPQALLGDGLARDLGVIPGNKFVFLAQDRQGEIQRMLFRVAGILHTGVGDIDDAMLVTGRPRLALFTGEPTAAHEIAVVLHDRFRLDSSLAAIRAALPPGAALKAYPWYEAMPGLADAIKLDSSSLEVTVFILFLLVGIGTINTLLMSVMERVREFGVFRALGVNRGGIRRIVAAEALVIALVGIGGGAALGFLASLYTAIHGVDLSGVMSTQEVAGTMMEPMIHSGWDWGRLALLLGFMFVIALLAALYPAHRALRIRPAEAMRKI